VRGQQGQPWRTQERVIFTTSDPALIRLFLRFLDLLKVPDETVAFRLYIHENATALRRRRVPRLSGSHSAAE